MFVDVGSPARVSRTRRLRLTAALAALTTAASLAGPAGAPGAAAAPAEASAATSPGATGRWADLRVDANRDGRVDLTGTSDAAKRTATLQRGAIYLANLDDDAGRCPHTRSRRITPAQIAACSDASDQVVNGGADALDLAPLRTVPNPRIPADAKAHLRVRTNAAAARTRLFIQRGGHWRHLRATDVITAKELRAGLVVGLEGTDIVRDARVFDGRIGVTLTVTSGRTTVSDTVALVQAPLLVQPTTSPVRRMVIARPTEQPQTGVVATDLRRILRPYRVPLTQLFSAGLDLWTQDQFEPMVAAMPGPGGRAQTMQIMLLSPQERSGSAVVYRLRGRDVGIVSLGRYKGEPTLDATGNVEALPAYGSRPLGRVIMGYRPAVAGAKAERPLPALTRMLTAQTGVAPMLLDTGWLSAAHIDEIMHVMPTKPGQGGRGWKLAVVDPAQGLQIIRTLAAQGHGTTPVTSDDSSNFGTVTELLKDAPLVRANTRAATRVDAAMRAVMAEVGLTKVDIIRVPGLFRMDGDIEGEGGAVSVKPGNAPPQGDRLAAMLPSALNGVVLEPGRFLVARQFGPVVGGKDVFAEAVTAAYRTAGVQVTYLDTTVYHVGGGEIHCGTNAIRVPTTPWWKG